MPPRKRKPVNKTKSATKSTENVIAQNNDENQVQSQSQRTSLSVDCIDAVQKDSNHSNDPSASTSRNSSVIIISSPTQPENRKRRSTENLGCPIQGTFYYLYPHKLNLYLSI